VRCAIARRLCARDSGGHPLRVGIDGVCGAGKTTFAKDLAEHLTGHGRPVVRINSDGFHHIREIRYRQGKDSARGYYQDAYDFDSVRDLVLVPLGSSGPHRYASRVHDLLTDAVVREWATARADAVVLFDATFLQRDDLCGHWDEVIYLDADTRLAQARGLARDEKALGGPDAAALAYEMRYMAACTMYLSERNPKQRASIVVQHDDPAHPRLIRL